jgi:dihydrodipicolinate synthase/N-acetylneuraminate lyase
MKWQGVIPAITTPFHEDLSVDHEFLAHHADVLVRADCTGIVALGSLGESATLAFDEKVAILKTLRKALEGRAPVVAGIAALSTRDACDLARAAEGAGCGGLMVLPPYVYRGDDRETDAHISAVLSATGLPCMLYNNPIAYGTDVLPPRIHALAKRHGNLVAVKESSADIRRITELKAQLKDRLALFVGVDDLILEGIAAGATGWIAGLVNALPQESVRLFDLAMAGQTSEASKLYEWFLPLLRLDTLPKFVQLIKLVQAEIGLGSERVRPPRLVLAGAERAATLRLVRQALAGRPLRR